MVATPLLADPLERKFHPLPCSAIHETVLAPILAWRGLCSWEFRLLSFLAMLPSDWLRKSEFIVSPTVRNDFLFRYLHHR
jgi:hypothetical protein